MDPLCSSAAVDVVHSPSAATRFARIEAVAGGEPGVADLVVCLAFPGPPWLNCGECEKCVRTMAALLALGRLDQARRFPEGALTADAIRRVDIGPHDVSYWSELLPALEARRADLARVVREKLEDALPAAAWHAHSGWKGRLRRWDRRLLGGRLVQLSRRLRQPAE
jgi:hypothetical protein